MFIIHTDEKPYQYIVVENNSKMSLTSDINNATLFKKKQTVENLIKSNLNSKKKRTYTYTYSSIQDLGLTENDIKNIEGPFCEINSLYLNSILSNVTEITNYAEKIELKLAELNRNLSNIDKACTDLDHYMELNNLSASDGWKIYKQKQKILKIRRKVKNQIFSYQQILSPLQPYLNGHIARSIEGLKTQKYSPRIMTGLFDINKKL